MEFIVIVAFFTFLIEILIGSFILVKYKISILRNILVIFVFFLAFYQFFEFLLCTTNLKIWALIAFICYTFLPAFGIHFILNYIKKSFRFKLFLIYILPVFFTTIAIFKDNFITKFVCSNYYVLALFVFSETNWKVWQTFYLTYYFGFVLIILILLIREYFKIKGNKHGEVNTIWFLILFLSSIVPTIIFMLIIDDLYLKLPSIYCHFSIISAFILLKISSLILKEK